MKVKGIVYELIVFNLLKGSKETIKIYKDDSGLYHKGYSVTIEKVHKGFYLSSQLKRVNFKAYKFLYHASKFHIKQY